MLNFLERVRGILQTGGSLQQTIRQQPAQRDIMDIVVGEGGYSRTLHEEDTVIVEQFGLGTRITIVDNQDPSINVLDSGISLRDLGRMNIDPSYLPPGFSDQEFVSGQDFANTLTAIIASQQPASSALSVVESGSRDRQTRQITRQTTINGASQHVEDITVGQGGYTREKIGSNGTLLFKEVFGLGTKIFRSEHNDRFVEDTVAIAASPVFPEVHHGPPIGFLSFKAIQRKGIWPLRWNSYIIEGEMPNYRIGGAARQLEIEYPRKDGWIVEEGSYRPPPRC